MPASARTVVVSMYREIPKDRIPPARVADLRAAFPGVEFRHATTDGDLTAMIGDADAAFCWSLRADDLAAASRLRWVHSNSVGQAPHMLAWGDGDNALLTNGRGLYTVPMAELIIGLMVALARRLPDTLRAQARREWCQDALCFEDPVVSEIAGKTLLILGFGGTGRELAVRARAMGMTVWATRKNPIPDPLVDRMAAAHEFRALLPGADVVAVTLPLTVETDGMLGAAELARMKPDSLLVNVARGRVIDEPALTTALTERRIRGAALDAFAVEPLPSDSPLWDLPNVMIVPHNSGFTDRLWDRSLALFSDNLTCWLQGQRSLRNEVPKGRGY